MNSFVDTSKSQNLKTDNFRENLITIFEKPGIFDNIYRIPFTETLKLVPTTIQLKLIQLKL